MPPLDILIAEDNPKDFEFLDQLLQGLEVECRVERAHNGQVALDLALGRANPLVISDIQMPELNGIEFARELWQRQPTARIVFWSQYKDEMYVRALSKIVPPETVYGYILKSNTKERIASAIRTVLLDDQCWIDPEVRKVQGRAGHSQTALTFSEFRLLGFHNYSTLLFFLRGESCRKDSSFFSLYCPVWQPPGQQLQPWPFQASFRAFTGRSTTKK